MDVRRLSTISNLPWAKRIVAISDGLKAIHRNIASLRDTMKILKDNSDWRGYSLVQTLAEEEAGKYLILLDYVRYTNRDKAMADKHLRYFYDHFVRLLYAQLCQIRPATWGEILDWLERQRRSVFTDGPNDVDWVFRNEIVQNREGALYVDYVDMDGEAFWISPTDRDWNMQGMPELADSLVIGLVERLEYVGTSSTCALKEINEEWADLRLEPSTHWQEIRSKNIATLKRVEACRGSEEEIPRSVALGIIDTWSFPLHGVDLEIIKVNRAELEEFRQNYRRWDW